MRRTLVLGTCLVLALVPLACGGGGGGGGGGTTPVTPPAVPTIDVAAFMSDVAGSTVHIYRDVLRLPSAGAAPDVKVSLPQWIEHIGFTGTHLVVAQDLATPSTDRLHVYTPADLASTPVTPSIQVLLPAPAGTVNANLRDFEVWDDDLYVHTVYDDAMFPTHLTLITHVFRDLSTLTGGASPDATVLQFQLTVSGILGGTDSIAIDDDVLLATGLGNVYVTLDSGSLTGNVTPDRTIAQEASLGMLTAAQVAVGGGEAYFYNSVYVAAFDDLPGLIPGRTPRYELYGPSEVIAVSDAIVRVNDRLFTMGPIGYAPVPVVGFEVGGPVLDTTPPDVRLGPPSTLQSRLAGAADVLVVGDERGVIRVYADASQLQDGDDPVVVLFDLDAKPMNQVRAVER